MALRHLVRRWRETNLRQPEARLVLFETPVAPRPQPPYHAMRSAGHGATFADARRRAECRLRFPRGEMRRLRNAIGDRPHDRAPAEAYSDLAARAVVALRAVFRAARLRLTARRVVRLRRPRITTTGRRRGTPARRASELMEYRAIRGGQALAGGTWKSAVCRLTPRLQGEPLNHPSRRLRHGVPWWWRAAGIAARDGAARAGPDVRRDRGRAWTAVPPDR